MSEFFVAVDGSNEPTIWRDHLYSDPEALVRLCDLPAKHRTMLWAALSRGFDCEVRS